ncbi:diacylglycerol kinase family protein [uncultured Algibacter sp.]|uniref:diacylglycerol/lipid kinase family protein n=1 Tax=uncultured Algibacter sp. TaxID=298659 RepID=UPI00260620EF|nr:diacylglycerol kinase family protein [uncultured Algibacter sp.]
MTNIHFIINPIAGSAEHDFSEHYFQEFFEKEKYNLTVKLSEHKGHAIDLTKASINQGVNVIVACGGDGTINEVASTLIGVNIPLGIIPVGSGNGLASNLKISRNVEQAIQIIKKNEQTRIDVGCINERYFFSNSGFGFDANVIENYEASQKRTLYCYVRASIKSFMEFNKKNKMTININGNTIIDNPFLIFVSNSNELGYNVSLTPKASLQDGLLDILIVPKINKLKMVLFGVLVLLKRPHLLKGVKSFQTKAMTLSRKTGEAFESQIDGEFIKIKEQSVSIHLKEKSLVVIV